MSSRSLRILLIEDNLADADLVKEGLVESGIPHELKWISDGAQALLYLDAAGPYAGVVGPDLVLLDLNLPRVSGFDVLAHMKTDAVLKRIPVLIFSSSTAPAHVLKAYDMQANCYMAKPTELEGFFAAVKRLESFWLGAVTLPTRAHA